MKLHDILREGETPPEVSPIPAHLLARGPDAIRGGGLAFIVTKYPDPDGHRWFSQPGSVGHEEMTNSLGMLQALFGPRWQEVADEVVTMRDEYVSVPGGNKPSGKKLETWDYFGVRRQARKDNLFGRAGTLSGHKVVMLWNPANGWQDLLREALDYLGVQPGDGTVVTVGDRNQFMADSFLQAGATELQSPKQDEARMELLQQYHTATGKYKEYLARQLGIIAPVGQRPGSLRDWGRQAADAGLGPYVASYGESKLNPGRPVPHDPEDREHQELEN